jgi:uncharacterized protein YndB with AHSA1/START domain
MTAKDTLTETLVLERTFNAPVETVWKAITELDRMKQWYFEELESFQPEVGFQTQFNVHHNGKNFLHLWKVTAVVLGQKITYSWKYGGFPGESFVTFELFAEADKTRLRLTHSDLETFLPERNPDLARENFEAGWKSIVSQLQPFVEEGVPVVDREFVISRTFDAPRDVMWKAWTESEQLAKWFGPKGVTIVSAKNDLRLGGVFHYGMRTPDGTVMWGKWIYREIVPPERLVFIVSFSDEKGGLTRHPFSESWPMEMLSTVTFAERQGKTEVTVRWTPHNATESERKTFDEGHEGMKQGWSGTFDQLADYLAQNARSGQEA